MTTTPLRRVYDLVERRAAATPDREALSAGDIRRTWAELDERVRRLAGALRAAGVGPGDRIATLDKNHPACLELTLAASLVGAANAVVNVRLSPSEITYVVNDAQARLLVAGAEFAAIVDGIRGDLATVRQVVVLGGADDGYEAWLSASEPVRDPYAAEPGDCFLQLYTSGTTGFPKGAMLTHRSMIAHTERVGPAYAMDESTVNVVVMPLFHVGGTSWALGSMHAGGRTIVVRELAPDDLLSLVEERAATHLFLVPAAIRMLIANPDRAARALASLRVLGYGGEPMPVPLVRRVLEVLHTDLYSVYGMTEMSGVFCVLPPQDHRDPAREHLLASAGRPLPGNEVRVVDPETMRDVPAGRVGEFWVRSEQQMGGYWQRPEATAETLVADGWLRTGDAGRIDAEGYVFLEDRVKDMIISGGENVYPAEVERVLLEHPSIAEAAVIGMAHEKWGETPLAAVVARPGARVDSADVIAFCRARLAHYKCPTSVVTIDALPRNATGKVLKRELRGIVGAAV
ncbi:MAG: long-chain-fatty-acid--CoA ligase [Chloroflexi bacterium]|nr:MAG: long-chain-fatty-acid--CoA ligase [Chloroflexota bacterium]